MDQTNVQGDMLDEDKSSATMSGRIEEPRVGMGVTLEKKLTSNIAMWLTGNTLRLIPVITSNHTLESG